VLKEGGENYVVRNFLVCILTQVTVIRSRRTEWERHVARVGDRIVDTAVIGKSKILTRRKRAFAFRCAGSHRKVTCCLTLKCIIGRCLVESGLTAGLSGFIWKVAFSSSLELENISTVRTSQRTKSVTITQAIPFSLFGEITALCCRNCS